MDSIEERNPSGIDQKTMSIEKFKKSSHAVQIERVKKARKNEPKHKPPKIAWKSKVYKNEGDVVDYSYPSFGAFDAFNTWASREASIQDESTAHTHEFFLKVSTFGMSLATCETVPQFTAATMQFLASIASRQIVDWFASRVPASNEGPSEVMEQILAFTRNVRGNYAELLDTPLYKFFLDVVGMAAVCGHIPSISIGDCPIITAEWAKSCAASVMIDFPSVILRSIEFTLEVVTTFARGGNLSTFVSGRGVLTLVSRVLAREQDVKSHMLEAKHNISVERHMCDASLALVQLKELLKCASGATFVIASAQRAKLEQHIANVESFIKVSGFRERPFAVLLAGPSGVGKSTCMNEIYRKVGKVCDFPSEPENVAEVTETDKYDSTITGLTTIIQMDDFGQMKENSNLSETPHAKMIRFNNTAPSMAIKADAPEKGCIPLRPKLIALTSNTQHLQAAAYMEAPEALLISRINSAVWVTPKDYCCDENGRIIGSKVLPNESPHWIEELTYKIKDGKVSTTRGPKRDFDEWLPTMLMKAKAHKAEQQSLKDMFEAQKNFDLCIECCQDIRKCKCKKTYANEAFFNFFQSPRTRAINNARPFLEALNVASFFGFRQTVNNKVEKTIADLSTFCFWSFVSLFRHAFYFTGFTVFCTSLYMYSISLICFLGYIGCTLYITHLIAFRSKHMIANAVVDEMVLLQTDFGSSLGAAAIGSFCDHIVIASAFLPILAIMRMLVRSLGYSNEGNILVTNHCSIRERRAEANEWLEAPKVIPIASAEQARTTSLEVAINKVMSRVCRVTAPIKNKNGRAVCNGLNVYADWLIIPRHSYRVMDVQQDWEFKFDDQNFGPNRVSRIDVSTLTNIRDDHVAFRVFKLNKNGDLRHFFPTEKFTHGQLSSGIIVRKLDGGIHQMRVATEYRENLTTAVATVSGVRAIIPETTQVGDCGSPWFKEGNPRIILGLHNGRHGNDAMAETLYYSDFDFMTKVHKYDIEGRQAVSLPVAPLVDLTTKLYGEEILTSTDITPSSCMNFCTENDGALPLVEVYGSCRGLSFSTSKSHVCRSPLSLALESEGLSCIWGKPPLNVKRNHEMVFEVAQHPIDSISGVTMRWAKDDYLSGVLRDIEDIGYTTTPLTDHEIYNGRKRESINPMNMKTSPGVGLTGRKSDHCEVVLTDEGNVYTPKPYIYDEVSRLRELAISGKRTCPISKTALKDEPTKLTKDTARIFYVMPMAFIAICRQVMCPILAYMMSTPLTSESWFGIKVTTNEWGQCFEHLNKFRNGNMMNGDYSKYDLHFSSQLIFTVGEIFASMGHSMGYPPWAVAMLASIFSDLANPVYAYAGSLISFLGLMPSGNPATVAINGIGNSLLHRCFFYEGWLRTYGSPPAIGAFRKFCSMGFVGDDSIGGVSSQIPWFNMQNFQSWLAQIGMPYTPADKAGEMPLYVDIEDASLCKRKFAHMDEGVVDAPIELASIFKSMHMLHKAQDDPRMITALNVTQGLRELARWPRRTFEKYHGPIKRACELVQLPVTDLDRSYDSWRGEIIDTYNGVKPTQIEEDDLSEQHPLFDRKLYSITE